MEARHAYQGTPCIQRWQTFDFIVGVTGKVFSSWNKGAEEDYSSKRGVTNHYLRLGPFGQQHINSEPFSLSPLGKKSNSSEHSKLCGGKREEYLVHVSSFCWRLINRVLEKGKIGCMCLLFGVDWKIICSEKGKWIWCICVFCLVESAERNPTLAWRREEENVCINEGRTNGLAL